MKHKVITYTPIPNRLGSCPVFFWLCDLWCWNQAVEYSFHPLCLLGLAALSFAVHRPSWIQIVQKHQRGGLAYSRLVPWWLLATDLSLGWNSYQANHSWIDLAPLPISSSSIGAISHFLDSTFAMRNPCPGEHLETPVNDLASSSRCLKSTADSVIPIWFRFLPCCFWSFSDYNRWPIHQEFHFDGLKFIEDYPVHCLSAAASNCWWFRESC